MLCHIYDVYDIYRNGVQCNTIPLLKYFIIVGVKSKKSENFRDIFMVHIIVDVKVSLKEYYENRLCQLCVSKQVRIILVFNSTFLIIGCPEVFALLPGQSEIQFS